MKSDFRQNRAMLAMLFIAALCAYSSPLLAQDSALPDSAVARAGFNQLPEELQARWLTLSTQVDQEQFKEYLSEGELTIKQLGELILAVGGTPPERDKPAYATYSELQSKLIGILDRIELAMILKTPDEDLRRLLTRYQSEKEDLSIETRREREDLVEAGTRLLKSHENDPYFLKYPHRRTVLADLYFRLTELLYAESYDRFLESTDRYLTELDSLRKVNPQAASSLAQPQPDYSRVIGMYQRLVDEFPTSDYADDALYNLGLLTATSETATDRAAANKYFETLVRIYPDSEYKLNCLRRIGEYYFNPPVNDLDKAISIYSQIVDEFANSEYISEAHYKLGWCYYRLSDMPMAIESFAKSLDTGFKGDSAGLGETGLDIATESINYIGVCFAVDPRTWNGAGVDNMVLWLQSNPTRYAKYGRQVVSQLGEIYRHQVGRYADGVVVYNKYLELWPLDRFAPEILESIVEVYQQGEIYNPQAAHSEKIRYYKTFNPDSDWWRVNTDPKLRDAITLKLERYLDMIIDETLALATDSKDPALYLEFEQYCRQYLRFWPKGPNVYKVHYNLAGILERIDNRHVASMREYWQVATAYSDTGYRDVSTQRVVAIAQELLKRERDGEISINDSGEVAPPKPVAATTAAAEAPADSNAVPKANKTPLLNSERLILAGFDLHLSHYPKSALAPTMLYQAGDILYQHDWFPESRKYLELLIVEFPDARFIEDAYKLILEGYFKSGEYANVEKVNQRIAESNVSKELKETAKRRKAEAVFLTASNLKQGNDPLAAAAEFKRVALESPDYQYADRSLFQSGLEYMNGKAYREANEVFLIIADKYPQSEYADKALYNAGFNLQSQMKDLAGAAALYERLAVSYPKSDLAQGALANASMNYNQVEDHKSAIRANTLYVQMYPTAEDASVYLFENASHHMKLEEVDKANEIYRQFATRYPDDPRTVQAFFERGKYALDKGDRAGASKEFTTTLEAQTKLVGRGLGGSPKYASQALSYLLSWEQVEYEKLRFTGAEAQVKAAKERKKQWRNSLLDKYQQLIRFGQKEAYRAFYAIGRLDEDFALATYQQDVPGARDMQGKIDALAKVIDEAILLNTVAQQSFKNGFDGLRTFADPLKLESSKRRREYDAFSAQIAMLQKDTTAVGVADSLVKQTAMQRSISEIDSAIIEAAVWSDSCRHKVPEVAIRNGLYLSKLWYANFALRSNDKDEEVRLLFREEAIKNAIAPMAPEIVGLYLQAWNSAKEVGLGVKWRDAVEDGYHLTVDSLLSLYVEQTTIAQRRTDNLVADFAGILPKGPDAKTKQGLYSDELGAIILDQVDYINAFTLDMLAGYQAVLDTLASYNPPYGFGEEGNDYVLKFVVEQSENFKSHSADASKRKAEYGAKYDETSELQWDDAQVAFEDIALNFNDYSLILLEQGLSLRQTYHLSGMAGITLVEKLVSLNPDKYGAQVGLSSESMNVVTNPDWKVWPLPVDGFQNTDFDDYDWKNASSGGFPEGQKFGKLDTLNAVPIWFQMEKPVPTMGMTPGLNSPTRMAMTSLIRQTDPGTTEPEDTTGLDSLDWIEEVTETPVEEAPEVAPETEQPPAAEPEVTEPPVEQPTEPAVETPIETQEEAPVEPAVETPTETITEPPAEQPEPETAVPTETQVDTPAEPASEPPAEVIEPAEEQKPVEEPQATEPEPSTPVVEPETVPVEGEQPEELQSTAPDTLQPVAPVEAAPAAPVPTVSAEADSIYRAWMSPDSAGLRKYWFRKTFNIDQQPSAGKVWITCDDDFNLFVNGVFVAEDDHQMTDWMNVNEYSVLEFLKLGRNVIAVEASDLNNTRQGLIAGLAYEYVPDMTQQLSSLKEREIERDRTLKAQADEKLRSDEAAVLAGYFGAKEEQPTVETQAESAPEEAAAPAVVTPAGPTPEQIRDMRIIEKNKLR